MSPKKNEIEVPGLRRITKKILLDLCKKNSLYQTPYLNDVLYLHYQGFRDIEGLDEYTGLKSLWLECNAISEIGGLTNQPSLKCLFLQHNLIRKIENLNVCTELDTLNLSHNHITNIENCGIKILPVLTNLNLANNYIRSYDGLRGLLECKMLSTLDLSNNRIDDALVVKIFGQMPELRVLVLQGNPVVGCIPQYRKTLILECKNLTYLDSRPVFAKDRACAEAWKRGGYEEEKAEQDRWAKEDQRKMYENIQAFIERKNFYKKKNEDNKVKELTSDEESFKSITSDINSDSEPNSQADLENEDIVISKIFASSDEPENLKYAKDEANTHKVVFNEEIQILNNKDIVRRTKNKRRRRARQRHDKRKGKKNQNKGYWPRSYKLREEPEVVLATAYMYHEMLDLNFDVDQNLIFSEKNLNKKLEVYKKAYDTYLNHVSSASQLKENFQNKSTDQEMETDENKNGGILMDQIENENQQLTEAVQKKQLNTVLSSTEKCLQSKVIENRSTDNAPDAMGIENKSTFQMKESNSDCIINETIENIACNVNSLAIDEVDDSLVDLKSSSLISENLMIFKNETDFTNTNRDFCLYNNEVCINASISEFKAEKNQKRFENVNFLQENRTDFSSKMKNENKIEDNIEEVNDVSKIKTEVKILDNINVLNDVEVNHELESQDKKITEKQDFEDQSLYPASLMNKTTVEIVESISKEAAIIKVEEDLECYIRFLYEDQDNMLDQYDSTENNMISAPDSNSQIQNESGNGFGLISPQFKKFDTVLLLSENIDYNENINLDLTNLFDEKIIEINMETKTHENLAHDIKEVDDNLENMLEIIKKTKTNDLNQNNKASINPSETKTYQEKVSLTNIDNIIRSELLQDDPIKYEDNNSVEIDKNIINDSEKSGEKQVDNSIFNGDKNFVNNTKQDILHTDENCAEEEMKTSDSFDLTNLFVEGTSCLQKPSNI